MLLTDPEREMDSRIVSFLENNTNLTLATCVENLPHCANCFYAFDKNKNLLIIKSKPETIHVTQGLLNHDVAGTIVPDLLIKAKIQGIQFRGVFHSPTGEQLEKAQKIYYRKFPFARVVAGEIWAIELTHIKMTDNTLGFGKKTEWSKTGSVSLGT